jgi:hypothetical protein
MRPIIFILALASLISCSDQKNLSSNQINNKSMSYWISSTSCSSDAHELVNKSITSALNVEIGKSLGFSEAALMIDKGCGAAKIAQAAVRSSNEEWGSRAQLIDEIEKDTLTANELAWLDLQMLSNDERVIACEKYSVMFPRDGIFSYCKIARDESAPAKIDEWISMFPGISDVGFNLNAYSYGLGWNEVNIDQQLAENYLAKYLSGYVSANSYDSIAELNFTWGNYDIAKKNQQKAVDLGGVLYSINLEKYTRYSSREQLLESIKASIDKFVDPNNEDESIFAESFTACYSSMSDCAPSSTDEYFEKTSLNWLNLQSSDIDINFGPEMLTADSNFNISGEYEDQDGNIIYYAVRASLVWDLTNDTPKIIHLTAAPMGGVGLPE